LDDIPKDEYMEGQITWEEGKLEPLEVVEEWATMAHKQGRRGGGVVGTCSRKP
jgi:hypothetical protein